MLSLQVCLSALLLCVVRVLVFNAHAFQYCAVFFFSSRRRHTRSLCDWSFRRVLFRSRQEVAVHHQERPLQFITYQVERARCAERFRLAHIMERNAPLRTVLEGGFDQFSFVARSEERRVGKEGRSRWSPYH